ncbi:DUF2771 domain-containing protein [Rhodococcus sp. Eu-32]|uniref:DUF2771 domain-containing protein n=1 Tax=unclassified Rhodococcus (in: high G+C Gram-positive bacteria) TaxID=192944 RepID=UPI000DF1E1B8|nr:DUF2771 domain-containing protein [Rhodococcus sp. Eu-32]NIL76739.1 Uncharacterized protein [Rhodococcus sp. B10]RRQ28194.1 DUF2771 domain-containing protein [Rhodococcus sp. Eu-32]
MNLAPKTKKILAIGAAAAVVVLVAFVGVLALLVRDAPSGRPSITAFADGRTIDVQPYLYCPVDQPLCGSDGESVTLPVREGRPLQLSLPSEIASAPWILAAVYSDESGSDAVETDTLYLPDSTSAVTVPPVDDQGRALLGVEVRLPSGVIDTDTQQEEIVSHAIWSIATA